MSEHGGRLHVTLIGHAYLEGYVSKLVALARQVNLRVVLPSRHPTRTTAVWSPGGADGSFEVVRYPLVFPFWKRSSTRWLLASADLGFRRSSPEIVHVENERHSFIVLQTLMAQRAFAPQARAVVSVWDNHRGGHARERIRVPIGRVVSRHVDYFLAGSTQAKRLLEVDGVPVERITVSPVTGVDMTRFRPPDPGERQSMRRTLGLADDDFVVGYVGRLTTNKGPDDAFAALRALGRDLRIGDRLHWLVLGLGPLEAQLARWHGSGVSITHVAWQRQDDTVRYYHAMDALILPSRTEPTWAEQFGRTLVEGMACGTPVVGSDSGAIPEVIGDAGLVVPERDPAALAAALRALVVQPELRRTLAARGEERVARLYSDAAVVGQTVGAYYSALALPPRRRVVRA